MVIMIETIQERIRNMMGSFYNMKTIFEDLSNEEDHKKQLELIKYLINNSKQISKTMDHSIQYLIDMSKIIDENLPDEFDINKLLDKEKYQS
jgi:hypothetical protein